MTEEVFVAGDCPHICLYTPLPGVSSLQELVPDLLTINPGICRSQALPLALVQLRIPASASSVKTR